MLSGTLQVFQWKHNLYTASASGSNSLPLYSWKATHQQGLKAGFLFKNKTSTQLLPAWCKEGYGEQSLEQTASAKCQGRSTTKPPKGACSVGGLPRSLNLLISNNFKQR